MSPALNGSSAIRCFEGSDVIEIRDGITFDFYTGLPHVHGHINDPPTLNYVLSTLLSTLYVTHVINYSRPSPAFLFCKRWKAGWGLGTRLPTTLMSTFIQVFILDIHFQNMKRMEFVKYLKAPDKAVEMDADGYHTGILAILVIDLVGVDGPEPLVQLTM